MKINKYILFIITLFVIVVVYNSFKSKSNRLLVQDGIRPGNINSGVPLGRPMWN